MAAAPCYRRSTIVAFGWVLLHVIVKQESFPRTQEVFKFANLVMFFSNQNQHVSCFNDIVNSPRLHPSSFFSACACYAMGCCYYGLNRYRESFRYLNMAVTSLTEENNCLNNCVRFVLLATYKRIHSVKFAMGKIDEALVYGRKAMGIMESSKEAYLADLFKLYKHSYETYIVASDAEQAIPLCLKALEICIKLHGENSMEFRELRVDLATMYRVVGNWENVSVVWTEKAEIKGSTVLFNLGKYQHAIDILETVVSRTGDLKDKVSALITMMKASCMLNRFPDAIKYMKDADNLLQVNDLDTVFVNTTRLYICRMLQKMKCYKAVLYLSRKVCQTYVNTDLVTEDEISHQKILGDGFKMFCTCEFPAHQAIESLQFMKNVAGKLEVFLGQEHSEVGIVYARMVNLFVKSGREDLALELIEKAHSIMNSSLGPYHLESLRNMRLLSTLYENSGRQEAAAQITARVMEHLQDLSPDELE